MKIIAILLTALISANTITQAQNNADTIKNDWYTIHAQATVINQTKFSFTPKYTGDNSLQPQKESQTSITASLFAGARLWKGASAFINPEIAGGSGLSGALGIAAATNGETFRIGDPSPKIYIARLYFRQLFALSKTNDIQETGFNQLGGTVPEKYLSFTVGKIGVTDYFDNNSYSHDPRTQFMSWALMANGAWDYAANTRGYTPSAVLEFVSPKHELRYGLSLLPKTANGLDMNWNLSEAASHTLEYTHRHAIRRRTGAVRLLAFYNRTNMGNYRQAVEARPVDPVIQDTRQFSRSKLGFGINAEQELSDNAGVFFRASWNDGKNETWCFTEIDRSISGGIVYKGTKWKREADNIGLAYVVSGLSGWHKKYLAAGGKGFMLGDGALNYGAEHLAEFYYDASLVKDHLSITGAYQLLVNPGYNKDRSGPVNVFSVRLHMAL